MLELIQKCEWDNPAYRAEYQRNYRAALKEQGYRRLDIWIPPNLWEALYPLLNPDCRDSHPGAAVVDLLERVNS